MKVGDALNDDKTMNMDNSKTHLPPTTANAKVLGR
jgi:hypothetical protein